MRRIVMLGCGGFVGSHLLDELLGSGGFEIDGWDPDTRKITHHLENPRLHLHPARISDPGELAAIERKVDAADAVINLAAICNPADYNTRPLDVIYANLFDVEPIVRICAARRRWLLSFSTSEVYGRTVASYLRENHYTDPDLYELREDETPLVMGPVRNQRWTYACAKQMLERLILAYHTEKGLPFTIVRPLNFFGPRMDYIPGRDGEGVPRVLACFMAALFDRQPMQLVDGGRARRTIVSIHDAVAAIRSMLERPKQAVNQIFNIGNRDNEVTIAELADLMRKAYAEITGDPSYEEHPIVEVSADEFYGPGYEDCDRRMPDLENARRALGWTPRWSLRNLLLETMKDFHDTYAAESPAAMAPKLANEAARSPTA